MNWSRDYGEFGYFSTDLLPGGSARQAARAYAARSRAAGHQVAVWCTQLSLSGPRLGDFPGSNGRMNVRW
jgi:hypothetical protein